VSRASAVEALRSRELLRAARELFAAHPSGEVLVVIARGVEVPEAIRATAPAGEHRASLLPLTSALEVTRARSADAARDLADAPRRCPGGCYGGLVADPRGPSTHNPTGLRECPVCG